MSFLTVEDVNGAIFNYNPSNNFFEIDTRNINLNTNFYDVKYDFCLISRYKEEELDRYTFYVKVRNSLWNGKYYIRTVDGTYVDLSGQFQDNTFILSTSSMNIIIGLMIAPFEEFVFEVSQYILISDNKYYLTTDELINNPEVEYNMLDIGTGETYTEILDISSGEGVYITNEGFVLYINKVKVDFEYTCTDNLTVGNINRVYLNFSKYDDFYDLPEISIIYKDQLINTVCDYVNKCYYFDLDLSDEIEEGIVNFTVNVKGNNDFNDTLTDFKLNKNYTSINNNSEFIAFIEKGGVGRLTNNIMQPNGIEINKDIKILGDNHVLIGTLIINENINFKAENLNINTSLFRYDGVIQKKGSNVELTNCTFDSCKIGVKCDINRDSLTDSTDFKTKLTNCTFKNTRTVCILHGGELNVDNCIIQASTKEPSVYYYPYFLYQTDGNATITNSQFEYIKKNILNREILFNHCIFMCGETAVINGLNHDELMRNNIPNFLEPPFNNTSKIDVTYYYTEIEDFVILNSDNGFCHAVSGEDFAFKTNVKPKRDSEV